MVRVMVLLVGVFVSCFQTAGDHHPYTTILSSSAVTCATLSVRELMT